MRVCACVATHLLQLERVVVVVDAIDQHELLLRRSELLLVGNELGAVRVGNVGTVLVVHMGDHLPHQRVVQVAHRDGSHGE